MLKAVCRSASLIKNVNLDEGPHSLECWPCCACGWATPRDQRIARTHLLQAVWITGNSMYILGYIYHLILKTQYAATNINPYNLLANMNINIKTILSKKIKTLARRRFRVGTTPSMLSQHKIDPDPAHNWARRPVFRSGSPAFCGDTIASFLLHAAPRNTCFME